MRRVDKASECRGRRGKEARSGKRNSPCSGTSSAVQEDAAPSLIQTRFVRRRWRRTAAAPLELDKVGRRRRWNHQATSPIAPLTPLVLFCRTGKASPDQAGRRGCEQVGRSTMQYVPNLILRLVGDPLRNRRSDRTLPGVQRCLR